MARRALLVLDLINELVHPDGKYSHVCLGHATGRATLARAAVAVERPRAADVPVIFVVLAFSQHYEDWPSDPRYSGRPILNAGSEREGGERRCTSCSLPKPARTSSTSGGSSFLCHATGPAAA